MLSGCVSTYAIDLHAQSLLATATLMGVCMCLPLDPAMEDRIAAGIEHTERGLFVRMSPSAVDLTCEKIQEGVKKLVTAGHPPVVLVSPRIRPGLRQITNASMPRLKVLSYNEITQDTKIESYGVISDQ